LPERRVVITGMGVISPIGLNKEEFWSSLLAGCSGIKEIDRFPTDNFPTKIAAQVKDFQIVDYVSRRDARRMDLFVQFACAAACIAVEDAALTINDENRTRTGVWIASGIGGIGTLESQHHAFMKKGVNGISPFFIPMMIPNMAAGQVSIMLGAMGPNGCTVTACASASHSIGEAFQAIRDNKADVMITGGENDVNKGFAFHTKTADLPVPCNVSSVYVQFDFAVTDIGVTLLDEVQLRAVPWESIACGRPP
jgi:3-oxoacyl-[acyl-carrier-protein] synthase II